MKLIALGLSFGDVARAIEANNVSRGASVIERNGEGIAVRTGGSLENLTDIGDVVISTRGSVPVRVRDVAQVAIGGEIRTGSASENGHEVVVGTALMLIGSNSRTVAAAVDAKIDQVRRTLPAGIELQTVLNRTQLVDATVTTVATNLGEGALLVILVLFVLLGNFRAALITALVIPVAMLMTAAGMLQGRISANLMSLGALDFGLIVDGAVIITENALRHLAERQATSGRALSLSERLETVRGAAEEMIGPSVYGQAIIILVYVPLLTFSGVEGKMFEPMALTVILALVAAFVLSLTFVPALIAIFITGRVAEGDNAHRSAVEVILRAFAQAHDQTPAAGDGRCGPHVRRRGAGVRPPGPGVHPDAGRKKHRHARAAHSKHQPGAIAGHANRDRKDRQRIAAGRLCFLEDRHGRNRNRPDAAECRRYLHYLQATGAMA